MVDFAHVFGEDLQISPTGDIATVVTEQETQQRILHRLLTSATTYIWQISYGAGLPGLIGSVVSQQQIAAIIRAQLKFETSVATVPEPDVLLSSGSFGAITATITYTSNTSGTSQVLVLPIGG